MIVGITGGIGSGKSMVCKCLRNMGYLVFDADLVSRQLLEHNQQVRSEVIALLGEQCYHADGTVDRAFIAKQVFQDEQKLGKLNGILHPAVKTEFTNWVERNHKQPILFKEAAILFESGANQQVDKVLAVVAPKELRIKRIQQRDNRSGVEIERIMENQLNQEELISRSDFVINNDDQTLVMPALIKILRQLGQHI
ncbi:MAG: hypothetical protein RL090_766 [Bacteroidota bacterium]|jgi:dephospho-CoA kinase